MNLIYHIKKRCLGNFRFLPITEIPYLFAFRNSETQNRRALLLELLCGIFTGLPAGRRRRCRRPNRRYCSSTGRDA
ncbi:hypothetical protein GFL62_02150 [Rhizobium leguminosarum bv. viciae]|nr:hypothetical protein [Rhizobium leguminosarum bv. viciae]TCA03699.1 hypothetical protein E0H57_19305 [Rhizobium leguminosarum bv. viciae]